MMSTTSVNAKLITENKAKKEDFCTHAPIPTVLTEWQLRSLVAATCLIANLGTPVEIWKEKELKQRNLGLGI